MNAILRFFSIFIVTARRLIAQRGLASATTVGLVVGVAITMSIPIYADAVYQRIFKAQVETGEAGAQGRIRPPYAFMFRYIGSWSGPISLDRLTPIDTYLTGPVVEDPGFTNRVGSILLPQRRVAAVSERRPYNVFGI